MSSNPDASRAWLASQRPDTVDARIRASLTSQLGVDVNVKRVWMFPEGQKSYQVPTSVGLTGLSKENLSAALAKVESGFTPLTREQAETMVAQMDAVLSRRGRGGDTAELAMDIYVGVLMSHPADVATETVRFFTVEPRKDGGTAWFPAPPELEAHCRKLSAERIALRSALQRWKPVHPVVAERNRLEEEYRKAMGRASGLRMMVGPGPVDDTGPRGERIAEAIKAEAEAGMAKEAWLSYRPDEGTEDMA